MAYPFDSTQVAVAADIILRDYMALQPGEEVVITADTTTDMRGVAALAEAARVLKAKVVVMQMTRLPFQGGLADPFIPTSVAEGLKRCDVWLDFTFPYISGSKTHEALKSTKVRSLNILDLGPGGIARLFAQVDLDPLFELQTAFDALIAASEGKECRMTNGLGSDVTFNLGKPKAGKKRRLTQPGTSAPPGSIVILPEPASVRGTVVVSAVFHEWYTLLKSPMTIKVDDRIRDIQGGEADLFVFDRSLRRAGRGEWGQIIHFSHGFHPAARLTGESFNEDIRSRGADAIGFGTPWWEEGGGENHPDAAVIRHSFWIEGRQIVDEGVIVAEELAPLEQALKPLFY